MKMFYRWLVCQIIAFYNFYDVSCFFLQVIVLDICSTPQKRKSTEKAISLNTKWQTDDELSN